MSFHVHAWLDTAVKVGNGERTEWLPRLAFAPIADADQFRVLEWRRGAENGYGFDGWTVSHGHQNGGTYPDIHGALSWFDWLDAQAVESPLRRAPVAA